MRGPISTVLIVDDDDDLRETLAEFLLTQGVRRCITATSLSDVASRAEAVLAADLAILDVNLGDYQSTGVDVCRWLRERGFAAPIVFLTGHAASDPRVVQASAMPDTRVLSKPVTVEVIAKLVAR